MKQNNSLERRPYWVRREPVWGGTWAYVIYGRNEKGEREDIETFGSRAAAEKKRDRLNDDHERFVQAKLAKTGDRP